MTRRIALSLWMLAFSLALMTLLATGFGALRLPVSLLWSGHDETLRQIWLTIRLPRVLLALVIGGSLALAGCVMQGLFAIRWPILDYWGSAAARPVPSRCGWCCPCHSRRC
ncbi:transport system permease [Lelliottia amnigena]|nr:transport system permease [Lelliottia amnigena]